MTADNEVTQEINDILTKLRDVAAETIVLTNQAFLATLWRNISEGMEIDAEIDKKRLECIQRIVEWLPRTKWTWRDICLNVFGQPVS